MYNTKSQVVLRSTKQSNLFNHLAQTKQVIPFNQLAQTTQKTSDLMINTKVCSINLLNQHKSQVVLTQKTSDLMIKLKVRLIIMLNQHKSQVVFNIQHKKSFYV
jgi:hypothetical protein